MEAYTSFAEVYDLFMDNIPYDEWCEYLAGLLREHGVNEGLVVDLGCGTGSVTRRLGARGYDMIGIDNSQEMLAAAAQKQAGEALYLNQDMREFELYGTVAAAVSICDSINYILDYEDLVKVFCLVNNYLDPGGVFIFDLNTEYKYRVLLGDATFAEARDEASFIWENYYDEEEQINSYELTLFIRQEQDLYKKFSETHFQRAYRLEEIQSALSAAGLCYVCAYDAFTKECPGEKSERIYIIAREQGKRKED